MGLRIDPVGDDYLLQRIDTLPRVVHMVQAMSAHGLPYLSSLTLSYL